MIYFFLMLPLLVVFPISLSSAPYMQFPPPGFSQRSGTSAISTIRNGSMPRCARFYIGAATAVLALALGVPLAFSLARGQLPGRALLDRLALAPMIVPTIILSVAIYGLFAKLKLIGELVRAGRWRTPCWRCPSSCW